MVQWAIGAITFGGALLSACGDDPTGLSGPCEVIYATSNPPGPSGIEVRNLTGGGLSAGVISGGLPTGASDMNAGDCNVWAYPAGFYEVELQRCNQDNPGESTCTSFIGSQVTRSVTVVTGDRVRLDVSSSFFP